MAAPQSAEYDLMIVADATGSMGTFLDALNSSLPDILRISATTGCFSRLGVLAYRDYDSGSSKVTDWSGWHSRDADTEVSQEKLLNFAKTLRPGGGGDFPEATRSGLARAYQAMRPEAKTIILLYADAPPHMKQAGGLWKSEQDVLQTPESYGGHGHLFADWASAATTLSTGEKRAQVFTIIQVDGYYGTETRALFTYLSTRTGGVCLSFARRPEATTISQLTVGLLLAWMGADKQGAQLSTDEIATQIQYLEAGDIEQVTSEKAQNGISYLPIPKSSRDTTLLMANLTRSPVSLDSLALVIPRREIPVLNFSKRYKADPGYRELVVEKLGEIIDSDVSTIALNPVFGTLWRTVCNDRSNPARDGLITRFGLQVDKLREGEKKDRIKKWLEESYDWVGEILETITSVPEEARYPCVFLDPTASFAPAGNEGEGDDADNNNSMEFTRDELLEIGRSCDYRVLRRLGRVLTRLTYVNSKEELPAHVKDVAEETVPRIPMALAQPEHKRKFWKILLHLVLPGTMLSARPAALLAALSVRMGIKPLEEAAYSELMAWRNGWNTLDIPETWNSSCLGLLLEADKKHQQALKDAQSANGAADGQTILKPEDRSLFETLVSYKLLEMNMDTTLEATIGWSPNKSRIPLGPVVVCKTCELPRSVTIMGPAGVCGLCDTPCMCPTKEEHADRLKEGVSSTDNDTTLGSWVECAMTDCRAQYVVYNPGKLNVRPKCHYCRQKSVTARTHPDHAALTTAPCVTCTKCANRVIYPTAYRPSGFSPATYHCPACTANHPTLTTVETTPRTLSTENGTAFLLRNDDAILPTPFANRSLFHTASTATNLALLPTKLQILPPLGDNQPNLTINGKPIHNTPALLASLSSWILTRRVQSGTCTLCFSNFPKRLLRPACGGRRGCRQSICDGCVQGWYGLNGVGKLINVAALQCPFCRRRPTDRFVGLPAGVRTLVGLADAVEEAGGWVYGWCAVCGCAKRFVERECARGVAEVVIFWCEDCSAARRWGGADAGADAAGGAAGGGELVVKFCPGPGCGVATEKRFGCDHIHCTACQKHWCFNCGEKVADTDQEIYSHMTAAHGTWFGGGGDGEDYYEETDDEADWE